MSDSIPTALLHAALLGMGSESARYEVVRFHCFFYSYPEYKSFKRRLLPINEKYFAESSAHIGRPVAV